MRRGVDVPHGVRPPQGWGCGRGAPREVRTRPTAVSLDHAVGMRDEVEVIAARLHLAAWDGYRSQGRRELSRAVPRGEMRRIRRGVYVHDVSPVAAVAESDGPVAVVGARARFLERVLAVAATRRSRLALSHYAAAAVWQLPIAGRWPFHVDVLAPSGSSCRSKNGVRVHYGAQEDGDVVEYGGLLVTSPARTLLDLARSYAVEDAIVAADFALNPERAAPHQRVDRQNLVARSGDLGVVPGSAILRAVVDFADPASGSAGESCSRISIYRAGLERPLLQVRHASARRAYYETDFEWPWRGVIGEFDGKSKYVKDSIMPGTDPGDVVYQEKLREDELRAEGNRVIRWGWPESGSPNELGRILRAAGIRVVRKPCLGLGSW